MTYIYLSLCLLGGWLLGTVVAIVRQWANVQTSEFRIEWIVGGAVGALAYVVLGWLLRTLYRGLADALGSGGFWPTLAVLCAGAVLGALVAAPLSLLLVILDPHEILVAMLDFHGALLGIGALLGAIIGAFIAVRDHLTLSLNGVVTAVGALGVGVVLGLVIAMGVTLAWSQTAARP